MKVSYLGRGGEGERVRGERSVEVIKHGWVYIYRMGLQNSSIHSCNLFTFVATDSQRPAVPAKG